MLNLDKNSKLCQRLCLLNLVKKAYNNNGAIYINKRHKAKKVNNNLEGDLKLIKQEEFQKEVILK